MASSAIDCDVISTGTMCEERRIYHHHFSVYFPRCRVTRERNKHQNKYLVSAKAVRHSRTYIILYYFSPAVMHDRIHKPIQHAHIGRCQWNSNSTLHSKTPCSKKCCQFMMRKICARQQYEFSLAAICIKTMGANYITDFTVILLPRHMWQTWSGYKWASHIS